MGLKSKENDLLELFFNEPSKHWHFEELCKTADLNRKQVLRWLKIFQQSNLIKRIKPKGKMPYYVADYESADYQNKKKLFAINRLYESGFLNYLTNLKAQTIILFGSMTRWDWHKNSDIDLFIYGEIGNLEIGKYELKLGRDIQVFLCEQKKDLNKFTNGLLKNIIKGDLIKGNLNFIEVKAND